MDSFYSVLPAMDHRLLHRLLHSAASTDQLDELLTCFCASDCGCWLPSWGWTVIFFAHSTTFIDHVLATGHKEGEERSFCELQNRRCPCDWWDTLQIKIFKFGGLGWINFHCTHWTRHLSRVQLQRQRPFFFWTKALPPKWWMGASLFIYLLSVALHLIRSERRVLYDKCQQADDNGHSYFVNNNIARVALPRQPNCAPKGGWLVVVGDGIMAFNCNTSPR